MLSRSPKTKIKTHKIIIMIEMWAICVKVMGEELD
jgi:hypothetical protein